MKLPISLLPVSRCCEIIQYLEGKSLDKMEWRANRALVAACQSCCA